MPSPAPTGRAALGSYRGNVGRMAEADEQTAALVFPASDAASDINGLILAFGNG